MNNDELYWRKVQESYGNSYDLEEKARINAVRTLTELGSKKSLSVITELGCGNGLVLEKISQAFPSSSLIGVDGSVDMLTIARGKIKNSKISLINEDLLNFIKKGNNRSDAVLICNTLHNLQDRGEIDSALDNIGKSINLDGVLIFDIRNCFNPIVSYAFLRTRHKKNLGARPHLNTYSFFRATRILKRNGFKIEKVVPIAFTMREAKDRNLQGFFKKTAYSLYVGMTRFALTAPHVQIIATKNF